MDEFNRELRQVTRVWVMLPRTPLGRGPHLRSGGIVGLVWLLHGLLFLTGVTLMLASGQNHDLGLALVVGSLFGAGAVGGQVAYLAWETEHALRDRALGDLPYEHLMRLGAQARELRNQMPQPRGEARRSRLD